MKTYREHRLISAEQLAAMEERLAKDGVSGPKIKMLFAEIRRLWQREDELGDLIERRIANGR